MSLVLYNISIEKVINVCKKNCLEINTNRERLQMIRFSDDSAIVAADEQNLKRSLEYTEQIPSSSWKLIGELPVIGTGFLCCSFGSLSPLRR